MEPLGRQGFRSRWIIPLSPGMAVTAEIKTGERRVIEFFISPFIKHVDESLTLR